ncbi:MmgE/PrpD family protein [Mesorhizobium sp. CAU 1741]|uniref:MmgE/PrpD family protein n=1 Tax=Mesorhizobium sp. CAU 1741 TaxID=3140366 RepID=UPI00325AE59E
MNASPPLRLPTDPAGATGQLAQWLADLDLADLPDQALTRAKHLILDGVACALVGAQLPWSRLATEAITKLEGEGSGSLIGWGRKLPPTSAALLNGAYIQAFELDDYHFLAPIHSNAVVLPALFAAAQQKDGVTGAELLRGAIAGYEVGPRVGMALHGLQMLSRGWHSGAVFGTHAAAAAAGIVYRLDAAGFEDALGMAGTQSGGLMAAQFEAMVKRMHHGFSSRNGLYAAALAASGYTGIKRVFERDYGGFLSTFGEGHSPDASKITEGLGSVWECARISVKPYAAMTGHHAAIQGILELREQHGFRADHVEKLDIYLGHAAFHHGWWDAKRPLTATGAQMFIGYSAAVAVLDGAAMMAQYTPSRIDSDDVWEMISRIEAHHDASVDSKPRQEQLATRLEIKLRDGAVLRAEIPEPPGFHSNPMPNEAVVAKFHALTGGLIEEGRRKAIAQMILDLESLDDAGALLDLLERPAHALF